MQKKIIRSLGSFFFCFSPKLLTFFIEKQMTAVGLRQQGSQAVDPGSSLFRAKNVYVFTGFCQKFPKLAKR